MKERADEVIEEQDWAATIPVNEEAASRIAKEPADRLNELEADRLGERDASFGQDGRQHEENAIGGPQESERDDPSQNCRPATPRCEQLENCHAARNGNFRLHVHDGVNLRRA